VESRHQISSFDEYHNIKLTNIYELPCSHEGEIIKQAVDFNIHITNNDVISVQVKMDNKVKDAR
jgi:small nuclear ribonucleoprotein (snRNP)-like protein